jgi:hypothetical protein
MQALENMSRGDVSWQQDGLTYTELIKQEYGGNGCKFSAGSVEGHPIDTMYIAWGKDGHDGDLILVTPDELAAIGWVATGAVWVHLFDKRLEADNG